MGKIRVSQLLKEELIYELTIRGLPPATDAKVEAMRSSLRTAIKAETSLNESCVMDDYPYTFEEDKTELLKKVEEVEALVKEWENSRGASTITKCKARVEFALRRVGHANPNNAQERATLREIRTKLIMAMGRVGEESDSEVEEEVRRTKLPQQALVEVREAKFADVSKWGLKFSGDRSGSVNAFLERVEELRRVKGVTHSRLLNAAAELFSDKALIWFRAYQSKFTSWEGLVSELKAEFLPPNYDDRLWEEITRRTQGADETVGVYVATMDRLFQRLGEPCSPERKLRVLRRNLAPFYQQQLGLIKVESEEELIRLGRQLEATRASVEAYTPPPSRSKRALEPDLAYVSSSSEVEAAVVQLARTTIGRKCSNCGAGGHGFRQCPEQMRCFGCKTPGVRKAECPQCKDKKAKEVDNKQTSSATEAGNQPRVR